ncbi:MAG: 16S rRNA processing protein RimM [Candidatus Marinimicrobia bacterium]|nr:16S rRNA processing protein RimM [Candidatus Neomarinimicrobiota bacterium]
MNLDKIFHPIAKVTKTSGLKGDVCLKPLSRYFEKYINKNKLMIGSSIDRSNKISVEMINGIGKKRKFKFSGFDSLDSAKKIIGKTIFVQTSKDSEINWISRNILNYKVIDESGNLVGHIIDVMWLPSHDAYIIEKESKEYIIPIVPEIIKQVDYENRNIIIKVMDGLFN